jgi:hypothetical protein
MHCVMKNLRIWLLSQGFNSFKIILAATSAARPSMRREIKIYIPSPYPLPEGEGNSPDIGKMVRINKSQQFRVLAGNSSNLAVCGYALLQ